MMLQAAADVCFARIAAMEEDGVEEAGVPSNRASAPA
jgi:hypothetical protein